MRSLTGKLRNGLGEQSILSSLAHACTLTPATSDTDEKQIIDRFEKMRHSDQLDEIKKKLEKAAQTVKNAYYQCPNYDRVICSIIQHGLENLDEHCKLTPGVPLRPMLAYPTKGIHEVLKRFDQIMFTCEYKYDGERAQIHILEDGSFHIYSRNLEHNTSKYPDVIEFLQGHLNVGQKKPASTLFKPKEEGSTAEAAATDTAAVEAKEERSAGNKVISAILDAEVVAYDVEKKIIQPFQKLSTRKRKVKFYIRWFKSAIQIRNFNFLRRTLQKTDFFFFHFSFRLIRLY
jgi:DNA ligase-1